MINKFLEEETATGRRTSDPYYISRGYFHQYYLLQFLLFKEPLVAYVVVCLIMTQKKKNL